MSCQYQVGRLRSCCFLRLRTGVILITMSDLIHLIVLWYTTQKMPFLSIKPELETAYMRYIFAELVGNATEKDEQVHAYLESVGAASAFSNVLHTIFWIACFWFASSFIMLCGNITGVKSIMKPYVCLTPILIVTVNVCILGLVTSFFNTGFVYEGSCILSCTVIWTAELLFYWQIVRSRKMEIDDEKAAREERIATLLFGATKATT